MFNLKKSEILNSIGTTEAMVDYVDLITEAAVLNLHKPNTILEFGAGGGGWAVCINKMLNIKPKIHLIESFKWANDPIKYNNIQWPKTEEELKDRIKIDIPDVTVSKNFNTDFKEIDVLRYDATTEYSEFVDLIRSVKNPGVVIIDDFNFNCDIDRISYALTYSKNNNLYPLLFGVKSSIWVTNKKYRNLLLNLLKQHENEFNNYSVQTKFTTLTWFMGRWEICCATYIYESLHND